MPQHRLLASSGAVLGALALVLQLGLFLHSGAAAGLTPGQVVWRYFGYFTILTNLLVVLALAAWAVALRGRAARFLRDPVIQTAVAVAIVIVLCVYHLLLRQLWQPQGWPWVADQLLHTVMPVWFVAHWWWSVPKVGLGWRHPPACLAYPAAYAAYALLRGAIEGWYPYPFIDVGTLGYARVGVNACGLLVAFALVAGVMVALGRWQARRLRVTNDADGRTLG